MVQTTSQKITVAFDTEKSFQQAQEKLTQKDLATVRANQTLPRSAIDGVAQKRTVTEDGVKSGTLGGLVGAILGGLIVATALNIPNMSSINNNAVPLLLIGVFVGAAFGGAAGGMFSFFAGAALDEDPAKYRLAVEGSSEEIKTATQLLLEEGGRLL